MWPHHKGFCEVKSLQCLMDIQLYFAKSLYMGWNMTLQRWKLVGEATYQVNIFMVHSTQAKLCWKKYLRIKTCSLRRLYLLNLSFEFKTCTSSRMLAVSSVFIKRAAVVMYIVTASYLGSLLFHQLLQLTAINCSTLLPSVFLKKEMFYWGLLSLFKTNRHPL